MSEDSESENGEDIKDSDDPSTVTKYQHHQLSLRFVRGKNERKESAAYSDTECFWVFPASNINKEEVFTLRTPDLDRLRQNQWLNDEIINFMMKYIYAKWPLSLQHKVFIFNSFHFALLAQDVLSTIKVEGSTALKTTRKSLTKEVVRKMMKQTKKLSSIFDREYIVMPICDQHHWVLAIIWNHDKVWKHRDSTQRQWKDDEKCTIIVMDSMNRGNSKNSHIHMVLVTWLMVQAFGNGYDFKNAQTLFNGSRKNLRVRVVKVPQQPNQVDCGCFMLRNVLQFGSDGGLSVDALRAGLPEWYHVNEGVGYRKEILNVVDMLAEEQYGYIEQMVQRSKPKGKRL